MLQESGYQKILNSVVTISRTTHNAYVKFGIDNESCFVSFDQMTKQLEYVAELNILVVIIPVMLKQLLLKRYG